jgi:peptide/nickel transport system substrate-binding protein
VRSRSIESGVAAIAITVAVCMGISSCGTGQYGTGGSRGDILTIALSSDVSTLDPWMTRTVTNDLNVLSQIYTPLVSRGGDLKLQPALAESWKQTADRTWRFDLRDDVYFTNGARLNAEVAAWNINSLIDPNTGARAASTLASVTDAVPVNDTTLEIHTKEPDASIPARLTTVFLVEPTWRATHDPATETMGSGPYELVTRKPSSEIVLRRRDDATATKSPTYANVRYKIIPEESARIASIQTGAVDVVVGFGVDQLDLLNASSTIEAGSVESTRSAFLYSDAIREPMSDPRLRQAVNYAIDKELITDKLLGGLTKPSQGQVLTPDYAGFNPNTQPYPHDPERARELLAQAGFGAGLDLQLIYPAGSSAIVPDQVTQVIQAELAEVGIDLRATSMPNADFVNMNYERQSLPELGYMTYNFWTLDGADLLSNFVTGGAQQFWKNDEFDRLITAALATSGDQRDKLTAQADEVMREDAGFIFLFPQPLTYAHSTAVDFQMRPDEWVKAFDITAAQ